MFLNRVLPGSSLEMCHHSIVTGAAASDGAASDGAASEATADGATSDAAELGAVVAPPPVQAPNTRAITPIAPSNRQRVVTADLLSFLAPPRGSRSFVTRRASSSCSSYGSIARWRTVRRQGTAGRP